MMLPSRSGLEVPLIQTYRSQQTLKTSPIKRGTQLRLIFFPFSLTRPVEATITNKSLDSRCQTILSISYLFFSQSKCSPTVFTVMHQSNFNVSNNPKFVGTYFTKQQQASIQLLSVSKLPFEMQQSPSDFISLSCLNLQSSIFFSICYVTTNFSFFSHKRSLFDPRYTSSFQTKH